MKQALIFGEEEAMRLHALAVSAARQTGATGERLDGLAAKIFASLAEEANRAECINMRRNKMRVVAGNNG